MNVTWKNLGHYIVAKKNGILGDGWWPQTAKQKGDEVSKKNLCSISKNRNERPHTGGVY